MKRVSHPISIEVCICTASDCEPELATVISDWAKILDNKGQLDTFILDFEKAFNTPPHELLKSKLFSYG